MAKSGLTRSSVTVSEETTGCHHTCIAVFLGKNDFADTNCSGQVAYRVPATTSVITSSSSTYDCSLVCFWQMGDCYCLTAPWSASVPLVWIDVVRYGNDNWSQLMPDVSTIGADWPVRGTTRGMSNNVSILNKAFVSERNALGRLFQKMGTNVAPDDLLQTLWIRIQRVAENPPIHNGKAYLFRLASNLAIDQGRVDARVQRLQDEARSILYGDETNTLDAEKAFLAREELERVIAVAKNLTEPTRTIFWLNRIKGMSMGDVARIMGVSRTTADKHLKRAIAQLGDARDG